MNEGKHDIVTQTIVVNQFQGHHSQLNVGDMGFMPFLSFDIKNNYVEKFGRHESVLAEPVMKMSKNNQWVRLDFQKFQRYGRLVGLLNKTKDG